MPIVCGRSLYNRRRNAEPDLHPARSQDAVSKSVAPTCPHSICSTTAPSHLHSARCCSEDARLPLISQNSVAPMLPSDYSTRRSREAFRALDYRHSSSGSRPSAARSRGKRSSRQTSNASPRRTDSSAPLPRTRRAILLESNIGPDGLRARMTEIYPRVVGLLDPLFRSRRDPVSCLNLAGDHLRRRVELPPARLQRFRSRVALQLGLLETLVAADQERIAGCLQDLAQQGERRANVTRQRHPHAAEDRGLRRRLRRGALDSCAASATARSRSPRVFSVPVSPFFACR